MDETNLASRIISEIVEPLKRMNIEAKVPPVLHDEGSTTGESTIGSDDSTIASSNMSLEMPGDSPQSVGSVSSLGSDSVGSVSSLGSESVRSLGEESSGYISPPSPDGSSTPFAFLSPITPETGKGFLLSDRNLATITDSLKGIFNVPAPAAPAFVPAPILVSPLLPELVPALAPIISPKSIIGNGFALSDENLRKIVDTLKTLTTNPPDLVSSSIKSQEGAMMIIEIDYGNGKRGEVVVHDGDDPRNLAAKFIKDYGLNIRAFPILVQHISKTIAEHLAELEATGSSPALSMVSESSPESTTDSELAKTEELGSFLTTAITDAMLQKPSRFKPLIPPFKLGLHLPGSTSEGYELGMPGLGTSSPSVESDSGRSLGFGLPGLPGFGSHESSDKSSGKATVGSDSGRGLGLPGFDESGKSSVASDSGKATVGSESSPESESGDSGKPSLKSSSKLKKVVGVLKRLGKKPEPGLKLKNLLRTLKKFLSTGAESDSESESDESEFGTEESEFDSEEEESEDGSSKRGPPAEASEENEDKYEAPDPFTNIGKISMPELNTPKVKYINIDKDKFAKPAGVDLKDLINISIQPEVK